MRTSDISLAEATTPVTAPTLPNLSDPLYIPNSVVAEIMPPIAAGPPIAAIPTPGVSANAAAITLPANTPINAPTAIPARLPFTVPL